jgi:TatA/E family protein of Tat protein translocase
MLPFGLSFNETIIIFVLALLLFGPKKLPELGRTIAKVVGEFRRTTSELKYTWDQQMRDLDRSTQDVRDATNSINNEIYSYNYDASYDDAYGYSDPAASGLTDPVASDESSSNDSQSANLSIEGGTAVQATEETQSDSDYTAEGRRLQEEERPQQS